MRRKWWSIPFALAGAVGAVHAEGATPAASAPPAPQAAAAPASPTASAASALAPDAGLVAPLDTDQQIDTGLLALTNKSYEDAAALLFGVYEKLPLSDSRRDLASYHLATALVQLGATQGGVEHYLEILSGRRSPALMEKTLEALKPLYEKRLVDEERFVEGVLYGGQFNSLAPDIADFVEYLQALSDIRHGFGKWGRARLAVLAHTTRPYSFSAKYALAVERIAQKDDGPAAEELKAIIASPAQIPFEIRNKSRMALGRILYEKKLYDEAWEVYSKVDSPLPLQDIVLLERAWDRVASGEQPRALGLVVGLGAPVFHNVFSPERYLIRGLALRRLCQYRAAHLAVREFRANYRDELDKVKAHASLKDDPQFRSWAVAETQTLREHGRVIDVLTRERPIVAAVGDKALHAHLETVYANGLAIANRAVDKEIDRATEKVADELLRIDEQMSLVDYEIGAGLFQSGGRSKAGVASRSSDIPAGSDQAYFKFDGEYWSDELGDYAVMAEDRCVR